MGTAQTVVMTRISGTAMGPLYVRKPCGRLEWREETGRYVLYGLDGTRFGWVRPCSCGRCGSWSAYGDLQNDGFELAAAHVSVRAGVAAILGKPGYGFSGYALEYAA